MSSTTGNISANQRPARTAVSVTAAFASANRSVSCRSRTNARTTRMPVSCSRSTRFTVSMRACMRRNCGTIRDTMKKTEISSAGTATTRIQDSCASCCRAKKTPPMLMIGVAMSIVQVSSTSICTCCTSLVVRVISDGAPNRATSRSENAPTRVKTASRTSRPNAIAVRAPK